MHEPAEEILSQNSDLQRHIKNKNLDQNQDFGTENRSQDTLGGGGDSFSSGNLIGEYTDFAGKPGRNLKNEAEDKYSKRCIE